MAKKELQVSAIENGTVIDHIPADKLFDVINVLGITGMDNAMTFGANLKSSKLGKKAIIKIWDKFLEDDEVNKLALVAPSAKINIIRKKLFESSKNIIPHSLLISCKNNTKFFLIFTSVIKTEFSAQSFFIDPIIPVCPHFFVQFLC